jgi:hypothetical protein
LKTRGTFKNGALDGPYELYKDGILQ